MPVLNKDYADVTPGEGLFAGTDLTFQKTYYSDSAKTTEVDPSSVVVTVYFPDGTTTTPTPTNPTTGVYKTIVAISSGITTIKWTATDASSSDYIRWQYVRTSN